jgi:hypothetical protein
MTTKAQLKARILRLIGDPDGATTTDELLGDAIEAAHTAILPWVFKQSTSTFTCDGATSVFELPADMYKIVAVFDSDSGYYIPASSMAALQAPGQNIQTNQDWLEYPEGSLALANAPAVDASLVVYYAAAWIVPESDNDDLETPGWCATALALYGASYALLQKSTQAADIRQWNVRVDSGTPVMNPVKDMSTYFMDRFFMEVKTLPSRTRGARG